MNENIIGIKKINRNIDRTTQKMIKLVLQVCPLHLTERKGPDCESHSNFEYVNQQSFVEGLEFYPTLNLRHTRSASHI